MIAADCLRVLAVRPTDDFFYGDREMYACLNWCYHLEKGVTHGLRDNNLADLMSCLMDFASKSFDCWVNTSIWKGAKQMGALRSAISKLKEVKQPRGPEVLRFALSKLRVGWMR